MNIVDLYSALQRLAEAKGHPDPVVALLVDIVQELVEDKIDQSVSGSVDGY